MRVLLACYHTSLLYNAIAANGHTVESCDLKPAVHLGTHHQCDLFELSSAAYDLIIAFPPCTYLCKAQYSLYNKNPNRYIERDKAIAFVKSIWKMPSPMMAIENPIGYLDNHWLRPSILVHPWWFGDPYKKDFCFRLRNLPPLMATSVNPIRKSLTNHTNSRMSQALKSEIKSSWDRFPKTCKAVADQWCPPGND